MAPTPAQAQAKKVASTNKSKKQPKARVQRYLKSTASQLREPVKSVLLLKGIHCSQEMGAVLQELRALAAPHAKLLNKKNQIAPFESPESIEFLTTKNDCALFALASTNKKRPNNLTIGRTFHHQMLDMCELTILRFKSAIRCDYDGQVPKKRVGSKPLLLFCGPEWQHHGTSSAGTGTGTGGNSYFGNLQNLLTDFYRGTVVDKLILSGLDHIIVFTLAQAPPAAIGNNTSSSSSSLYVLYQRTYYCKLKKNPNPNSGTAGDGNSNNIPLAYLEPCGPDFDFLVQQNAAAAVGISTSSSSSSKQLKVGRNQWADSDLYKAARRQPAAVLKQQKQAMLSSKKKNQSTNLFGETVGRLHLQKQNVVHATGRKSKALRRAEKLSSQREKEAVEQELQREETDMDQEFQQTFGFSDKQKDKSSSKGKWGKDGASKWPCR